MTMIALVLFVGLAGFVAPASIATLVTSTASPSAAIVSGSSPLPVAAKLIATVESSTTTTISPITSAPAYQSSTQATQPPIGSALLAVIRSKSNDKSNEAIFQVATAFLQKEKKWLQSEKWLIDNVYRLRNELNSLKREVAELRLSQQPQPIGNHRSTAGRLTNGDLGDSYRSEFVHDIGTLRADHNALAQQQQQLMQLLKDTQQQLSRAHVEQQAHQQQMLLQQKMLSPTVNNLLAYESIPKSLSSSASSTTPASTESRAALASELHSIRDASVTLYRDLASLQKQVLTDSAARVEAYAAAKQSASIRTWTSFAQPHM